MSGSGKSQPRADVYDAPELTQSLNTVASSGNIPIMTLMDDGGIQMAWQTVPDTSAVVENSPEQLLEDKLNKEPEKLPIVTEKKLGSSPKEEAQKVKQRTRKIK